MNGRGVLSIEFDQGWSNDSENIVCNITCNADPVGSAALDSEKSKRLRLLLTQYRKKVFQDEERDLRELSGLLSEILAGALAKVGPQINTDTTIEFSCPGKKTDLITDFPWELAYLDRNGEILFDNTLAEFRISRVITNGSLTTKTPRYRLKALACITSPSESTPLSINPEPFEKAFKQEFLKHAMIDFNAIGNKSDYPSFEKFTYCLERYKPNILILVAHGTSDTDSADGAYVLFGEDNVTVTHLASKLGNVGSLDLVILLCCDLTKRPKGTVAGSGALSILRQNIPQVVAMQGMIEIKCAVDFVSATIENLMISGNSIVAVAKGRQRVRKHSDSSKPALFTCGQGETRYTVVSQTLSNYKQNLNSLFLQQFSEEPLFKRLTLEKEIKSKLRGKGLEIIKSGFGCGATMSVISTIQNWMLDKDQKAPAPIFYIDIDRWTHRTNISQNIINKLRKFPQLTASSLVAKPDSNLEGFLTSIDDSKIILIIDHLTNDVSIQEKRYWKAFFTLSKLLNYSLVVLINPPTFLASLVLGKKLWVPAFKEAETREYLKFKYPDIAVDFRQVHGQTGGVPLLVDLEMQQRNSGKKKNTMSTQGKYAKGMKGFLNMEAFDLWCELAIMDVPIPEKIIVDYTSLTDIRQLNDLSEGEAVFAFAEDSLKWYFIHNSKRTSLMSSFPKEITKAAKRLITRFESAYREGYCIEISLMAGGYSYLRGLQNAYSIINRPTDIINLAILSQQSGSHSKALWDLYLNAYVKAKRHFKADDIIQMAEFAVAVGRHDITKELLSIKIPKLSDFQYCQDLKIRSAWLKDTKQHAAIKEIESYYQEAFTICDDYLSSTINREEKQQWSFLKQGLLNDKLAAHLYLGTANIVEARQTLSQIEAISQNDTFALSLCAVAEYMRKQDKPNWEEVLGFILRAEGILSGGNDLRSEAICFYQYGRYHESNPIPDYSEAANWYERSYQSAKRSGEKRREALALFKLIKIKYDYLKSMTASVAAAVFDEFLATYTHVGDDSLSLRAMKYILEFRAELEGEIVSEKKELFLKETCIYAAFPQLSGESDKMDLKRSFINYLNFLRRQSRISDAQRFLNGYKKRLAILTPIGDLKLTRPWEFIDQLRNLN